MRTERTEEETKVEQRLQQVFLKIKPGLGSWSRLSGAEEVVGAAERCPDVATQPPSHQAHRTVQVHLEKLNNRDFRSGLEPVVGRSEA